MEERLFCTCARSTVVRRQLLQWVAGHQISINSKDDHGNTVLHLAVAKKHIQIIKLLLTSKLTP
ncbi:hypothetical protein Sjap_011802 [Stephania japonica]|uniref:Ankyrin repeat protein n=1 Tax=Stephania japonica TaxID=461633 RepID=A0AAP0JD16_9MAGN